MAIKSKEAVLDLGRPFLLQVTPAAEDQVEKERVARGLKSRSETLRLLIDEGLFRAERRRAKGLSVDIGGKGE